MLGAWGPSHPRTLVRLFLQVEIFQRELYNLSHHQKLDQARGREMAVQPGSGTDRHFSVTVNFQGPPTNRALIVAQGSSQGNCQTCQGSQWRPAVP